MPCFLTGSAEGDADLHANEARILATNLTRMLCIQLEALEKTDNSHLIHGAVLPWWEQHKAVDKQRRENEKKAKVDAKLAEQAKKKLTKDELKALGLR